MIFCNIRTDFNFIFGQFSVARELILNGGAIRPIGLLSLLYSVLNYTTSHMRRLQLAAIQRIVLSVVASYRGFD